MDNVGYALEDLDGDGKEELLISAVSKEASGGMLYDVYTVPNGEVIHVLSGHERNRYYLQWLELMQGVVFNAAVDEKNPWFITYDEDWETANDTHDVDVIS